MRDILMNPLILLLIFILLFLLISYSIKNNLNQKILQNLNIIQQENENFKSNIELKNRFKFKRF